MAWVGLGVKPLVLGHGVVLILTGNGQLRVALPAQWMRCSRRGGSRFRAQYEGLCILSRIHILCRGYEHKSSIFKMIQSGMSKSEIAEGLLALLWLSLITYGMDDPGSLLMVSVGSLPTVTQTENCTK